MSETCNPPFEIREARPGDEQAIAGLIRELAEYERLSHECHASAQGLRDNLFGPRRAVEALVAVADGEIISYALFFQTFSTFLCRPGMYLEDLYVRPSHRRQGIGAAMMRRLGELCVERGLGRLEWSVLTWNELAASQYRKLGAAPLEDWRMWRLTGAALTRLAAGGRG